MQAYMCLLFDSANHVRSIEKIHASEDSAAMTMAVRLSRASCKAIGYELWRDGHKIASEFRVAVVARAAG